MSFELEATIRDLLLSLLVVKNKSIKLLFVTWNKISLPICLLLTHELLQNAKLISFITRHHYTETTQCLGDMLLILCSSHNPLQTGLKITNRQHSRQSLLFNHLDYEQSLFSYSVEQNVRECTCMTEGARRERHKKKRDYPHSHREWSFTVYWFCVKTEIWLAVSN